MQNLYRLHTIAMHKDKESCGEELFYDQEVGIPHNLLAVAVKKIIENEHKVVAHIPSNWSSTEWKYYANYTSKQEWVAMYI